jgi:hypothetical protein
MSPTLGCYGDVDTHTPNVDALAKEHPPFTPLSPLSDPLNGAPKLLTSKANS